MTENLTPDGFNRPDETEESASPLRVALGFFILPMLLVVGAVGVFLLFGLIAHEDKTVDEYLAEVTGGGINEPWQGAFGLANKLAADDDLQDDPALAGRIAVALETPNAANPDVRKFLVLALGRVGHESSVPVLVEYLDDPSPEVRGYTLWALGNIGAPDAGSTAPLVAGRLKDDDPEVRGYAAYLLGVLEQPGVIDPLRVALNDPTGPVRWNSAVALARLGSDAGLEELRRMIDRDYLQASADVNDLQQREAMIAAIQALGMLGADNAEGELTDLRDNDPDLRVREAARAALDSLYRASLP